MRTAPRPAMTEAGRPRRRCQPAREKRTGSGSRDIAVFSDSAHPTLAEEICAHLDAPLHRVRVQRFANDCLEVQLPANCRERDVFLIQPLVAPVQENLIELLLMLDAARGASSQYQELRF